MRGIDPARLIFAPRLPGAQHLARLKRADLFLDTLYYNAHTSASDALWCGVPVITCPGKSFAGRVAASLLRAVEMPELIAATPEDYERLAVALARDPARLAALKTHLESRKKAAPLFDIARFTRDIENAYRMMWHQHEGRA